MLLEVINLKYGKFSNFNIKFLNNKQYAIVGNINSGNELLFKILSTLIMTENVISFNDDVLTINNRFKYIRRIGVIRELSNYSFMTDNVYDELSYSLMKLNLKEEEINRRIKLYLKFFNLRIKTKKIDELSIYEKQLLLVITAIITEPQVILMEDIYSNLRLDDIKMVNKLLSCLVDNEEVTAIKFMNNFDYVNKNDYIYLMDDYEIVKEGHKDNLMEDDKFLTDHHLRVPFMYDLSNKLKMYKLIDKVYLDMEEMVNDIWK